MDEEQCPTQTELYLLSVSGKNSFSMKTAALELVSNDSLWRLDRLFFENKDLASLAARYCTSKRIAVQQVRSYDETLWHISKRESPEWIFAHLTMDKEGEELESMAHLASTQGLIVQSRTRTRY